MKNLLLTLGATCFLCSAFGQTLFSEDFENGIPANWTHNSTNWGMAQIWQSDTTGFQSNGSARNNDGPFFGPVTDWLETPVIDFSNVFSTPVLEFDLALGTITDTVQFSVWVSFDAGTNWQPYYSYGKYSTADEVITVDTISDGDWRASDVNYQHHRIILPFFGGQNNIKFAFGADFMNYTAYGVWHLDNVHVDEDVLNSIPTLGDEIQMEIFPNPAQEQVTISSSESLDGADVQLMDLNGKVILQERLSGLNHTLPLHELSAGTYLITVNTGNARATRRLVILP